MSQKIDLKYRIKNYLAILAWPLWLSIFIYALIKNPSTTDARNAMNTMKYDMAAILKNGGNLVYRNENSKFGGALLSVLISKDSWSYELRDQNIKTLVDLGWTMLPSTSASFCKHGALADIQQNAGNYSDIPIVLISMKYNTVTIKTCG